MIVSDHAWDADLYASGLGFVWMPMHVHMHAEFESCTLFSMLRLATMHVCTFSRAAVVSHFVPIKAIHLFDKECKRARMHRARTATC